MTSALPDIQVLVDWLNNPIGASANAGANFTDISVYVKVSAGVNITRGRQDNISVVQPSRCTFTVHNDDGRFTPGSTGSPYAPGVVIGRRVQVNVKDQLGTYHTRFDGMIAEYDVNDTATGKDTTVQIICTDVLSFLNRYSQFSCWTAQELAFQGGTPAFQYLMNEDSSAGALRDATGNNQPLAYATYDNPPFAAQSTSNAYWDKPAANFQGGNSPVEGGVDPLSFDSTQGYGFPISSPIKSPLPSVQFSQTLENGAAGGHSTGAASAQFQGPLSNPITVNGSNAFTLIGWVWTGDSVSVTTVYNPFEAICLSNTRTGSMLAIGGDDSGGDLTYRCRYYANYLTASPSSVTTGGTDTGTHWTLGAPLMVAVVVNGTNANFYVGGNVYKLGQSFFTGPTTITIPSGTVFNYLSIGGPIGGGNGWVGNISLVTCFNSALNTTQLQTIAQFGSVGSEGQATGTVFHRAAFDYTGVPSYWTGTVDTGLSTCDYTDITSASPSTVLQAVQAVENGLMFVDASGRLNFHDRSRRMGANTSPVTLPAGSYNPGIAPKINDQYLNNYASYQNERGGTGIVAQNAQSVARYGVYPNGSLESPQQAPYVTFSYTAKVLEANTPSTYGSYDLYSVRNVQDAANWDVNTLGEPTLKLAALTVDRLGNTSGQDEYVTPSSLYGIEIDSSVVIGQNLPWWPNSPMSSELFIEGVNETYSTTEATVSFYTTPAFQCRAWIPGNSSYGQLDVSARVGISKTGTLTGDSFLWPPVPSYGSSMNLGAGAAGFIGATDQAGISENLQRMVTPPLLFVTQKTTTQSFGFFGAAQFIVWDNLLLDTMSGFNLDSEGGIAYTVMVSGWYEIYATVVFASSSGTNYTALITHNQTHQPNLRELAPVSARGPSTGDLAVTTSAVAYCYAGDNLSVSAFTDSGTWSTSVSNGGSSLSLRYLGRGPNRN